MDTSKVQNISSLFTKCINLVSPAVILKKNTENVVHMSLVFEFYINIKKLPDISKWSIGNVQTFIGIFEGCKSLIFFPIFQNGILSKQLFFPVCLIYV